MLEKKLILTKWNDYSLKSNNLKEEFFMSEWDFYNKEINNISLNNCFLRILTEFWRENNEKRQSINMIKELNDFCIYYFKMETIDILNKIEKNEELNISFDDFIKRNDFHEKEFLIKSINDFQNKFLEIIEIFFKRNPKFNYYW